MIFETYTCGLSDGRVEYGYTFKESADTEDTLFDAMLGAVKPTDSLNETIDKAWADHKAYAEAMCAVTLSAEQRETVEERLGTLEGSLNGDETDDHDRGAILDEIAAIEERLEDLSTRRHVKQL